MMTHPHRFSLRRLMPALAGLLLTMTAGGRQLRSLQTLTLDEFRTRGKQEAGVRQWELAGKRAVLHGPVAHLDHIVLTFQSANGEKARITSPKCEFNQSTGIGQSHAPIQVRSARLRLDGIGYDFEVNKQLLRIHQKVRMLIKRASRPESAVDTLLRGGDPTVPAAQPSGIRENTK